MKYTINQTLELINEVSRRIGDLRAIRQVSAVQERSYFGMNNENRKEITPQYDVKAVDRKITELETWLFKAKSGIKQANAATIIDMDVDVDKLLEPLA